MTDAALPAELTVVADGDGDVIYVEGHHDTRTMRAAAIAFIGKPGYFDADELAESIERIEQNEAVHTYFRRVSAHDERLAGCAADDPGAEPWTYIHQV